MWPLFFFLLILSIVAIFIYWWIFSSLKTVPELDRIPIEDILKGKEEVAQHKVVIVGIIRDNSAELPAVIEYIEHTGKAFKDYKVIIFENDSKDGTKEILSDWRALNNRVKIISGSFKNKKRPGIGFLAQARNYYLDKMQNDPIYDDFDIVMAIDMDMDLGWDIRGIFDSFNKIDKWDIVCANGTMPNGKMRDAFAFRDEEFPHTPVSYKDYWSKIVPEIQKIYPVTSTLMPVKSCFGGMAFYKKKFIKECRYISKNDDCEHVAFHECLTEHHNARIVMNLAQRMHYRYVEDMVLATSFETKLHYRIIYKIKEWLNMARWRING